MNTRPAYVLLTAAKNEAHYIGQTIESVLAQSVRPACWVIMDDGSTDCTAQIVRGYQDSHPFIHLATTGAPAARSFGAQYRALMAAFELVRPFDFRFVAMLDADIELMQRDYYAQLLGEFARDASLGITGGYIHELQQGHWCCRRSNAAHSVAGGLQMFRRECFDDIGGYRPLQFGGEDWLAQIEAKARGWSVRSIVHLPVRHHRPTSSAEGRLRGQLRLGMRDASFGSHPLFELAKCIRRVGDTPAVLGAALRMTGYLWYLGRHHAPLLSAAQARRLRQEQWTRVLDLVRLHH